MEWLDKTVTVGDLLSIALGWFLFDLIVIGHKIYKNAKSRM